MKVFEVGGQEKVTAILSKCFVDHGHNVTIASFATPKGIIVDNIDPRVEIVDLHSDYKVSKKVICDVRTLLINRKIDVVINQWGLPFVSAKVLHRAIQTPLQSNSPLANSPNLKTIAIYHNDPQSNARLKDIEIALETCINPFKRLLLKAKMWLYKVITSRSMRYVYEHSNQYQVLSPSYIESFKCFTGIKDAEHLISLPNPVTIESDNFSYSFMKKEKEIIYCGRIDYNQKRLSRLIDAWASLENEFPDWKLTIVGDGVFRKDLECQAKELGLTHIYFEGFQQPIAYYKRASILALTSEYEGFPLVLAESMSFGVVPVVYDSFSAVHDIINNGINGIIVPKRNKVFSKELYADSLRSLMADDAKRGKMASAALSTSMNFSLEKIYTKWEDVFTQLTK